MYERESIFSKPVPPLLGYQGPDAALCPACSITDAIAKFRAVPEGWGPGRVGRRGCCRLGWPPRLSSWAGVWLCSCPGLPSPHGTPRPGQGFCCTGVEARPGLFQELQLARSSCGSRAALGPPGLPCYFRPSAVGGHWGFSGLRAHIARAVSDFIMFSISPFAAAFLFALRLCGLHAVDLALSLSPLVDLGVILAEPPQALHSGRSWGSGGSGDPPPPHRERA